MIRIVNAIEHDGFDERILTLAFEVPSKEFDLHAAIIATVRDFLLTEEGHRTWVYNCHCFNWADFAMHINDELCHKHGFSLINSGKCSDEVVNWDEDLTNGFEPEEEEEDC